MAIFSCKKNFEGDAKAQTPPETFMVVDKIYRTGDLRYTTTIEAHWWGSSTGIIKGYETSIDNKQTWQYTSKQSGTFLLLLPQGSDTADVVVYVRAIDNLGQKDLTPASTAYPIKNSAPHIFMDNSFGRKTSSFPAFRYYWNTSDTDGVDDISGVEISFNDTNNIYLLPGNTYAASFVAEVNNGIFSPSFLVYPNTKTIALPNSISGINYDSLNFFYVRVFDRSGTRSSWTKDSIYIRKPKSTFAILNDYSGAKLYYQNFYTSRLNAMGAPYNNYEIISTPKDDLPNDNFTCSKVFAYFKKAIWFSNDVNTTLAIASTSTNTFFYNGGTMLMVIDIGGSFGYSESLLSFTPVASFVDPNGSQFKLNPNDSLLPTQNGWLPLVVTSNVLNITLRPFVMQNSSGTFAFETLYNGKLNTSAGPWAGQSLLMAKRKNIANGLTNLVFSVMPFDIMQGNSNIDTVFKKIIVDELKF